MSYVPPDGPTPCDIAICGEAPSSEEIRLGRGFVGPSGKILWPVLRRLAGLERPECYVTNLCKRPLDNDESTEAKMTDEEFAECSADLHKELLEVRPKRILAVGALAAKALLPNFMSMTVSNGMTYEVPWCDSMWEVTPCWHPAAALRGSAEGKDPLTWMGDALAHFTSNQRYVKPVTVPPWLYSNSPSSSSGMIALDTEGTVEDPQCVTWANTTDRYMIELGGLQHFWKILRYSELKICYHNAPWDWAVLEAMGVEAPWKVPFVDTMELAYLRQTEPQGLKDLARRHFGLNMKSWEDVVTPYYNEAVLNMAAGIIDAGTTTTTHSPKTGKEYKKPKVERTEAAKKLARLKDPTKIAERLEFEPMSLRFVPFDVMAEYATLDPFITLKVWEVLK